MTVAKRALGVEAPADLRVWLAQLVERDGTAATAKKIGISREAVARIIAGLGVRLGTIALLREKAAGR
jgi:hypothetical protein